MKAVVRKEKVLLTTYPFSDPAPIPEFGRIYPYNRFDGYALQGADQYWDMVIMENSFIKLWINPAAGGKIWGAIEKSTGKEFIYFNHAAKFRDVAMRGPWTSGGIEFNVGILGHSLSCASPVDHHIRTNSDGSVSCFIGATDWPSRTRWFVEISLTADAAWFRTRTAWYNNSEEDQAYYSWSNAGIKTTGDLEYIFPGHAYLGHDGKAHPWPVDTNGRDLSKYDNNDLGHYKSYHVFGSASDFWGCYWQRDKFGMAHYSQYDQKPGKKIWIWGLSRYGMIWEDLLTDTDGQYSEVQSGRLFNQSISSSSMTPFKHRSFLPCSFDAWDEYWMPVKGIRGLHYSCPALSFHMDTAGEYVLHICANQPLGHVLKAEDKNGLLIRVELRMKTMEDLRISLPVKPDEGSFRLWLDDELLYDGEEEGYRLKRPTEIAAGYDYDSVEGLYLQGKEWERQRFLARAMQKYEDCLANDPFYNRALIGMAALKLRSMDHAECLGYLTKALSIDSYDGEANYLYGLVNLRAGNLYDAKDGFSIAGQSIAYRSAAMTGLAKIVIRQKNYSRALGYLEAAIACNVGNCQAYQLRALVYRKMGREVAARQLVEQRLQADPLDHLLHFELYKQGLGISAESFIAGISSEWPHETFIELASFYTHIEAWDEAQDLLHLSPEHPMVELWKAWLYFKKGQHDLSLQTLEKAGRLSPAQVFPHRHEDMAILQWAVSRVDSWTIKYFRAIGLLQAGKEREALVLLESCGNEPLYSPFYGVRAQVKGTGGEADLLRAVELAPDAWRAAMQLSKFYMEQENWGRAIEAAAEGYARHPDNYYLGLQLAKCYMYTGQFEKGIGLMRSLQVLPNEGASEGRNVWRETNLHAAIAALIDQRYALATGYIEASRVWPENIGVGKPYDVDERLADYLGYCCLMKQGLGEADRFKESILTFRDRYPQWPTSSTDLLALLLDKEAFAVYRRKWFDETSDSLPVRWCNALLDGDRRKLEALSTEKLIPPVVLPYEIPFEDRDFMLIKKLFQEGLLKI